MNDSDLMAIASAQVREKYVQDYLRYMFTEGERSRVTSRVTRGEIALYTQALWFARRYGQEWLENVVSDSLHLRVSLGGRGREEAASVMSKISPTGVAESPRKRGLLGLIFGR